MQAQFICLEEPAFYALIEEVVARVSPNKNGQQDVWISGAEAMRLLNVKSKTTMQMLRDTGKVKFSQPQKRILLYYRPSIENYLESNARNTF